MNDATTPALEFDPLSPQTLADPGPAYSQLRERCPFHHHRTETHDFYVTSRYDEIKQQVYGHAAERAALLRSRQRQAREARRAAARGQRRLDPRGRRPARARALRRAHGVQRHAALPEERSIVELPRVDRHAVRRRPQRVHERSTRPSTSSGPDRQRELLEQGRSTSSTTGRAASPSIPPRSSKERGVVIEEWRLGRGAGARMRDKQFPVAASPARATPTRLPIGDTEIIETAPRDTLSRVLQGLVPARPHGRGRRRRLRPGADGAADHERFGDACPRAGAPRRAPIVPRARPRPHARRRSRPTARRPARRSPSYCHAAARSRAHGGRLPRRSSSSGCTAACSTSACSEITQQPDAPFIGAVRRAGRLVRAKRRVRAHARSCTDGGVERGLARGAHRGRARAEHGFTATELDRASANMLRGMRAALRRARQDAVGRRSRTSTWAHFLEGDADPEHRAASTSSTSSSCPAITLAEVNALARDVARAIASRVIVVKRRRRRRPRCPTRRRCSRCSTASQHVRRWPRTRTRRPTRRSWRRRPRRARSCRRRTIAPVGVTEWTLSNGARVLLKPTDFKDDELLFRALRARAARRWSTDTDYLDAHARERGASTRAALGSFNADCAAEGARRQGGVA